MAMNSTLMRRLGIAKSLGFVIGLIAFFAIPVYWPELSSWFRWGILFWYTTFGGLIGIAGLIDSHPMFDMTLPFWFRGLFYGGWLNLVLTFLLYERLAEMMATLPDGLNSLQSPFWFVVEGMVLGLLIDWAATKVGGEGREVLSG